MVPLLGRLVVCGRWSLLVQHRLVVINDGWQAGPNVTGAYPTLQKSSGGEDDMGALRFLLSNTSVVVNQKVHAMSVFYSGQPSSNFLSF